MKRWTWQCLIVVVTATLIYVMGAVLGSEVVYINEDVPDPDNYWKELVTGVIVVGAANSVSSCRCTLTKQIVKVGDSAGQVFRLCGEPDSIVELGSGYAGSYRAKARRFRGGVKVKGSNSGVIVDAYIYEYYTTRLPLRIYVIGGKVTKITYGD